MAIPVSIRTENDKIQNLCAIPVLGGLVILLIALGPPSVMAVLISIGADHFFGAKSLFFTASSDPTPLYVIVASAGAIVWNGWLTKYGNTRIRILLMPAWAFGIMGVVVATIAYFAGWD